MPVEATVLVCFAEADYESFRAVLPNRRWHADFAAWRAAHEQGVQTLRDQGKVAIEQEVRSAAFAAWCRANKRQLDSQSLIDYAIELARLRIHTDH